jgi:hypothetical protein
MVAPAWPNVSEHVPAAQVAAAAGEAPRYKVPAPAPKKSARAVVAMHVRRRLLLEMIATGMA